MTFFFFLSQSEYAKPLQAITSHYESYLSNESLHTPNNTFIFTRHICASTWYARFGFPWKKKHSAMWFCTAGTERYGREAVQNQQPRRRVCSSGKWCVNLSWEWWWWRREGVHFIDWQGKGQSGGMAPLGLHRWSDISCEEIKTRPVNGANGEERPGCTIDRRRRRRRRRQEKWGSLLIDEGRARIKFDILPVILLISLLVSLLVSLLPAQRLHNWSTFKHADRLQSLQIMDTKKSYCPVMEGSGKIT